MTIRLVLTLLALAWLGHLVVVADESERVKVDLPGFEQGDLYILGRLSNEKLVKVERSEWVYVAILVREGLDRHHRMEAVTKLAEIRKSDEPTQILRGIVRTADAEGESTGALHELASLLLLVPPRELAKKRTELVKLATYADHEVVRQSAYAATILADGQAEPVWRMAEKDKSNQGMIDFLNGLSMILDSRALTPLFPVVETVVRQSENAPLRLAAIRALASIPGHHKAVFDLLVPLVSQNTARDAAVQALLRIPIGNWPKNHADTLANHLVKYLRAVDPTQRNSPEFKRARQLGEKVVTVLPATRGGEVRKTLESMGIRTVTIRTEPYSMKYDRVHVVVKAGQPLEITLENPDTWSHNLVIVAPGALREIGVLASRMTTESATWKGLRFVPESPNVLFATQMVHTLQSDTITVIAPDIPGEYPYVCTFPGHWASMNGTLHVVDDVDAWIAENPVKATGSDPQSKGFVKAWQLDDLADDLGKLGSNRSLQRGKSLFTTVTCSACHRVGGEGGAIGPPLDDVSRRFDPAAMLTEVLEPSKTINEQYRISVIELKDGSVVAGTISKQSEHAIYLVEDALEDSPPTEISRERISAIKGSNTSTMPPGLLNALTKDEILDLLAYIRSVSTGEVLKTSEPPK
jgi:putative heme-binding domain-containing protein